MLNRVLQMRISIPFFVVLFILALIASLLVWKGEAFKELFSLRARVTPFIGDTRPMKGPPDVLPAKAIVWKVGVSGSATNINIGYTDVGRFDLNNNNIEYYLKKIARGNYPANIRWKGSPPARIPRPTDLHRATPLSIENQEFAYMIFVFDSNVNWQFTNDIPPFEISKGNRDYYRDPKCVWEAGISEPVVGRVPPGNVRCTVASFISNAEKRGRNSQHPRKYHVSPFNFYVSLKVGGEGDPQYLPLVIDPDVGYPGGSQP